MTSVLFFAMRLALVVGACCFGLACLLKLREDRRRLLFFAGCLLGFWGGCVGLLADGIADLFVTLQVGICTPVLPCGPAARSWTMPWPGKR
jgi:hypothetical protein